ncbi:rhodanese-like domain-containing protein [Thalassospira alkalitolerans]|uniref:rhodanese-like domain-containing protein n=1 Tax=Thalassospira alkalitolerans TaxID=1293890 RepID=UPI003AA9B532
MTKTYQVLLTEAYDQITTIPTEVAVDLVGDPDTLIVDLRDRRELEREGKIAGAFHCPRGMLEFWIDPSSPYHKPVLAEAKQIVFYCASAWRSALAAKTAQDMGFDNVAHIEGGFTAWKEANGAVEPVPAK